MIQIGSLSMPTKWLFIAVSVLVGFIVLKVWLQRLQEERYKELGDLLFNSVFWAILVWKGSLLIFEPMLVVKSPLSLLYFTGGSKGLVLAALFVLFYIVYNAYKRNFDRNIVIKSILIFTFSMSTFHYLLVFLFKEQLLSYLSLAVLSFILLVLTVVHRKKRINKNIIVIVGLMGLLGWTVYHNFLADLQVKQKQTSAADHAEVGIEEGKIAPDFELKTIGGKTIKLSELKGKKVILNFWATWCPPCKTEMPHMQSFYEEAAGSDIEVLAVNLTAGEKNQQVVETFADEYGISFPILLDEDGQTSGMYRVVTIPTTYMIDSNGIIQEKIVGPMNKEMMNKLVNRIN
jgi:peroxiredoxin